MDCQKWLEIANNGWNCWKWLDIAGNVQNGLGWLDRAEIGWQSLEVTGNGLKLLERLEITGNLLEMAGRGFKCPIWERIKWDCLITVLTMSCFNSKSLALIFSVLVTLVMTLLYVFIYTNKIVS